MRGRNGIFELYNNFSNLKFNGMETFMAIVFLVFGILQIILFFKIWGMTNNVKKNQEQTF